LALAFVVRIDLCRGPLALIEFAWVCELMIAFSAHSIGPNQAAQPVHNHSDPDPLPLAVVAVPVVALVVVVDDDHKLVLAVLDRTVAVVRPEPELDRIGFDSGHIVLVAVVGHHIGKCPAFRKHLAIQALAAGSN